MRKTLDLLLPQEHDGDDAAWIFKGHIVCQGRRYGVAGSMSFAEPGRQGRGSGRSVRGAVL
jgi:hypothetical protein